MFRKADTRQRAPYSEGIRKALAIASFLPIITCSIIPITFSHRAFGADTWPGVDESVVEKFASERGREAHAPLINTDQGDLLLFVFLLAGTIGGFAAGYSWRMLMEGKTTAAKSVKKKR